MTAVQRSVNLLTIATTGGFVTLFAAMLGVIAAAVA
jgi:hypothetical protein